MNKFLYQIAEKYYLEYKENIRNFTFVFPNRRAGIFFQNYLTKIIDKPIFAPNITAINDCFFQAADTTIVDRTSALFMLYKIYVEISHSKESFDSFAYWGDILLTDFEEIDKYLINAEQLFTNIKDLKEIDNFFEFSENQQKALKEFWGNFLPNLEKRSNKEFIEIWRVLLPIYKRFREQLRAESTATEGMVFRDISTKLLNNEPISYFENKQFIFIGFNALNPSEKTLFTELKKRNQADFYWDYDAEELRDPDNKASQFYNENTTLFPSKFDLGNTAIPIHKRNLELISVPSAVGQTKEIYHILSQINSENKASNWINTAVVLPDENLLLPLLHSIPEDIKTINITMGYPLINSPVAGFVNQLFDLYRRVNKKEQFYHMQVSAILNHKYVTLIYGDELLRIQQQMIDGNQFYIDAAEFKGMGLLEQIFTPIKNGIEFPKHLANILKQFHIILLNFNNSEENDLQLDCDFVYQYYLAVNRFDEVLKGNMNGAAVNLNTVIAMIKKIVYGISIPFEGEPLKGLQIMGVLESRGIDFDNLVIPSFNEGVYPRTQHANSFISYTLRKGFGLPTPDYNDAVSAYNFYRLISRSTHITMLLDSRSEGNITGETSRYIHQLTYHYNVNIKRRNVSYEFLIKQNDTISIDKRSSLITKQLNEYLVSNNNKHVRTFSASSLNNYLSCPLKFYLTNVSKLQVSDEVTEEVKANVFGSIYHYVMEQLYTSLKGRLIQKSEFTELYKNDYEIDKAIHQAFAKEFYKIESKNEKIQLQGYHKIIANVIKKFVKKTIQVDAEYAPFEIIDLESRLSQDINIQGGKNKVRLYGIIDRVDRKAGKTRILDYKTGKSKLDFKGVESLTARELKDRSSYVFQTFFYSLIYNYKSGISTLKPEVLSMADIYKKDPSTEIVNKEKKPFRTVDDFSEYMNVFSDNLVNLLDEIFNMEKPFCQTRIPENCNYCDFLDLCNRETSTNVY